MKKPWDSFEVYEQFLALTEDFDGLEYLYENDTIDICGLKTTVLSAANTDTHDPCNDGSLIFKMEKEEQSILFTGDAGISRSELLLAEWNDLLASDYLQMAHHANGGLSDDVYSTVNPTVAFADCPEWLRKNIDPETSEPGQWTTPERIKLMQDMGAEVLSFDTAPNSVELY